MHHVQERPHNRTTNTSAYRNNSNIAVKLKTRFSLLCTHSWQDREYTHTHTHRLRADYRLHQHFCFSWPPHLFFCYHSLHPRTLLSISASTLCLSETRSKAEPLRASIHFHLLASSRSTRSITQHSQSVGPAPAGPLETHSHVIAHIYNQLGPIRSFVLMRLLSSDRYLALGWKRLRRPASLGVNQPVSFYKNNTVNSHHLF